MVIQQKGDQVSIDNHKFKSIEDLIYNYQIDNGNGAQNEKKISFLKQPIVRQDWELSRDQIKLGQKIGQGNFGDVFEGTMDSNGSKITVAVKIDKSVVYDKEMVKNLCKEARIMRKFEHKNIVKFHGITVDVQPLMLVMELVDGGSLDQFLRKNAGQMYHPDRIKMCCDAARGLEYLHRNGFIHRDVAARNCLITLGRRVKLSDFGLSKEMPVMGSIYMTKASQKLPTRW